jgi:hypothetical protein
LVSKLKRPYTEWEKIFVSHTSDKGLITRIYRKLKKLNSKKINDRNEEVGKLTEQSLFKGRSPNG